MSQTPFDEKQANFSLYAHQQAKRLVYPIIYPGIQEDKIVHQNGNESDRRDKVDVIVEVQKDGEQFPHKFLIQERWRRAKYLKYEDVTFTSFNTLTGKPVEFYEGSFDFMLYGYFDPQENKFKKWVYVDFNRVKHLYTTGVLNEKEQKNNGGEKAQDFKCFDFKSLYQLNCIIDCLGLNYAHMPTQYWNELSAAKRHSTLELMQLKAANNEI